MKSSVIVGDRKQRGQLNSRGNPACSVISTKRFTFLLERIMLHLDLSQNNRCTPIAGFDPPFLRLDSPPSLNTNGNPAPSADGKLSLVMPLE